MAQQLSAMQISSPQFDPYTDQVRIHFTAAEEGFATLVVFGPDGGWLLSLGEVRVRPGANSLLWEGRDSEGWPVADGVYTLELFGFDLARRPAAAAALRGAVSVHKSPVAAVEYTLTHLTSHWLSWGDTTLSDLPLPLSVRLAS
jgi:hypothetical protein